MGFDYRPYQVKAATSCLEALGKHSSTVVVMPCGAGKTEVITLVANRHLEGSSKSILILSHLSLLTEQTYERFKRRCPLVTTSIMQGERHAGPMSRVIISTMQTSRLLAHAKRLQDTLVYPVGLIIVDEAHHYPAKSYQTIREFFPEAKVLGFTATPFKDRKVMTSVFDSIAYSISLQELIDQQVLVPPVLNQIPVKHQEATEVSAQTVRLYQERAAGKKAIVYMRTIEDAKALRNVFESAGVRARAVTSELTGEAREAVLEGFLGVQTDVLTTVDVLTAGFDAPPVEAIFMPYGTKSPTQYLQRIGRGLRPFSGKLDCQIYLFGPAPSIAKDVYERQHFDVLNAGSSVERSFERVSEEMDYKLLDQSSEVYVWNAQVMEAVKRMEALAMYRLADMLDRREFPKRFLGDIQDLIARLPGEKARLSTGKAAATEAQRQLLYRFGGFTSSQVEALSRYEASMMISVMKGNQEPRPVAVEYVLPDGRYKGRPVWETPHAYRSSVKKNSPDSPVALAISNWEKRKA